MQAYTEQDYHLLMSEFGFSGIQKFSSLTGNENKIYEGLFVLTANKINQSILILKHATSL